MSLSPVTLAEWVNSGHCAQEALNEAGRLYIELSLAGTRVQIGGTDIRWGGAKGYRRSLYRLEVNAASIQCCWQNKQLPEGWDAADPANLSDVATWWDSLPLRERPIHEQGCRDPDCETCDVKVDALRRPKRVIKTDRLALGQIFRRWRVLPEGVRADFPLDPVVQAWTRSDLLAEDYMPDFRRYQRDVWKAVERDAEEMNGRDVPAVYESVSTAASKKHGKTLTEVEVDLLVGLLRAAGGPQQEQKVITRLISELGRLEDVDHGRVQRAFDYALGTTGERTKTLRDTYDNERSGRTRTGIDGTEQIL